MKLLKSNEILELDITGFPQDFICRCDLTCGVPHLHLAAEQTGDRRPATDVRRQTREAA